MIINPMTVLTLYVLPFAEGVDLFDGAAMRAAYCVKDIEKGVQIFSNWGPLQTAVAILRPERTTDGNEVKGGEGGEALDVFMDFHWIFTGFHGLFMRFHAFSVFAPPCLHFLRGRLHGFA